MDQEKVLANGAKRESHRKALTAAEVLQRYVDEDLPAFCGVPLTDVNQAGTFGEHPLEVAAVRGEVDEVVALLEGGADVNAAGEHGNTALLEAVGQGHLPVAKILLKFGARRDIRNDFGQTALDIARLGKRTEFVSLLEA